MFEGFETRRIATTGCAEGIHLRLGGGGGGPPLLLLHGYPETGACWHRVAPLLAERRYALVVPDLRGYGQSGKPEPGERCEAYTKRALARDMLEVMAALGHARFAVAGHDRGARVAHRLALDHPEAVTRVCTMDIVPTLHRFDTLDTPAALGAYHWFFLAQPGGLPERLIAAWPVGFLDHTLASWTAERSLDAFDERALAHYRAAFNTPDRIHAACEDYRAGWGADRIADTEDHEAGRRIGSPLLAIWGTAGFPAKGRTALDVWREWADDVSGAAIEGGHFLAEESSDATADALLAFFAGPEG
jgi:haloacetate dehalogenase